MNTDTIVVPFAHPNPGAIARSDDPRDHMLGEAVPASCPGVFMQTLAFNAPIYFQGKRPACGAHAGAWLKTFLDMREGSMQPKYTPRGTWIDIKKDGTSVSDGTDMRSIFKSLNKTGADTFEPLENDVTYGDRDYANPKFLTPAMILEAQKHLIDSYAFFTPTFQQIKQQIFDHGAVLLLLRVGDQFWTAPNGQSSWLEGDILPLRLPVPIVSGHFVVAHSYDNDYIYFANSFGPTWGRKGHGYFGINYMPFIVEAGTAVNPQATQNLVIPTVAPAVEQTIQMIQKLPAGQQMGWFQKLMLILQSFGRSG